MNDVLRTLYRYQAWANAELLDKLALFDPQTQGRDLRTALGLANHSYVVSRLFEAHLGGRTHSFSSDNTVETPDLGELRNAIAASDRWYLDHVETVAPKDLSESIVFTFTDGNKGCMTQLEMLMHVALHSTIHRGEISRILWQQSITPPWDTLAVYLHQAEPSRRNLKSTPRVSATG